MQFILQSISALLSVLSFNPGIHAAPTARLSPSLEVLYQFPDGAWVENSVLLPNGTLLVSLLTAPAIYRYDTTKPGAEAVLAYSFEEYKGLLGLTQPSPTTLAVVAGNVTLDTLDRASDWAVLLLDLHDQKPATVRKTFPVPGARLLNGLTPAPHDPAVLLIADSFLEVVWRLDTRTAALAQLRDRAFAVGKPGPARVVPDPVAVNGVHTCDGQLYFTNTNTSTVGRLALTPAGRSAGRPAEIVVREALGTGYDDFAIAPHGTFYLAAGDISEIQRASPNGKRVEVLFGGPGRKPILHPTSIQYADGKKGRGDVLYVTMAGAAPDGGTQGGQIVKVTLS